MDVRRLAASSPEPGVQGREGADTDAGSADEEEGIRRTASASVEVVPTRHSKDLFRFMDGLAMERMNICRDTDEEDWNEEYPSSRHIGSESNGYFRTPDTSTSGGGGCWSGRRPAAGLH
jgi:hypothetical protein